MSEESIDIVNEKKKPGPKPKSSPDQQIASARARRERRRGEVGEGNMRLLAPSRAGFVRRWVNDVVGRIDQFNQNGWDAVQDQGSEVRHVGGQKNPLKAVLMEIPEEFYQDDQKVKLGRVIDPRQMAESKAKSATADSPEEYIPGNKDSALTFDKLR